ncbi:hypothetical protein JCM16303_006705 [Sporobolomyces ruberrimus]
MSSASPSYSALLRRSKLASYNPHIDQVYTTTSPHLSRQNFGLKRPLPAATTRVSPFVRITELDSREGRTVFRKATRETSYVKRWQETGVGLQSEAFTNTKGKKWAQLQVQSRFVPESLSTETRGGSIQRVQPSETTSSKTPNFLAMNEPEFERYLSLLQDRREEFKEFIATEQSKLSSTPPVPSSEIDLYSHAQNNPNELVRLVERFLRTVPPPSSSSASSSRLPQIHPTLALQYATPTPLESALSPSIPGRLLGPSPTNNYNRSGPLSSYRLSQSGIESYTSVLSTISPISSQHTSSTSPTTFYPDASSIRSNIPGRAKFRLHNPTINPKGYSERTSIVASRLRTKTADFRPSTAEYEPSLLSLHAVQLNPVVETRQYTSTSPALRHPIGSPEYSGSLPPELSASNNNNSNVGNNSFLSRRSGGGGGIVPRGLSSYLDGSMDPGSTYKSLGVNQKGPRNLLASKKKMRTKEEQERWLATRESLISDRQNENNRIKASRGGGGKGKGGTRGGQEGKKESLMEQLESLLNKAPGGGKE